MVLFYKIWKKYNEIQLTTNTMDLKIEKSSAIPGIEGKKRGVSMESKVGTKTRSPNGLSLPNQNVIIIILYHDFLPSSRRVVI